VNHRPKLVACAVLLAGFHAAVLFAGFFAPYGYATQNRELPFTPPTRLHLVDSQGHLHPRPFVYAWQDRSSDSTTLQIDVTRSYPHRFFFSAQTGLGAINFLVFFTAARFPSSPV
jgi:hypothetical protein